MNKINMSLLLAGAVVIPFISGCNTGNGGYSVSSLPMPVANGGNSREVVVTPQAIPGIPRANNHGTTGVLFLYSLDTF